MCQLNILNLLVLLQELLRTLQESVFMQKPFILEGSFPSAVHCAGSSILTFVIFKHVLVNSKPLI